MFYYLEDYTGIGPNKPLKINLKGREWLVYGSLGYLDVTDTSTFLRRNRASKITSGMLQHFTNYESCLADDANLPHFESLPVRSNDIESMQVIDNAML